MSERVTHCTKFLSKRVKAIEDARHEETRAQYEKQRKRAERELYVLQVVLWVITASAWSAIITAAIVGD
jgi:hypothetical protein